MQKRVLEVLKTWYFSYSAFWSAGQWGGAIAPPPPPPHGYATGRVIRVSEPKSEMPIVALNSSSSKTNGTRRIKLSNLEASGHALSALKNKP